MVLVFEPVKDNVARTSGGGPSTHQGVGVVSNDLGNWLTSVASGPHTDPLFNSEETPVG